MGSRAPDKYVLFILLNNCISNFYRLIEKLIFYRALVACLHATCVCLAAEGGYTSAQGGGSLSDAVRELLLALGCVDEDAPRAGSVEDSVLRVVAGLDEPTRAWAFAVTARDIHVLLGWVERLGQPACEPRVDRLFRFAAACARRIGGRWPRPPTCSPPSVCGGALRSSVAIR